MVIAWILDSSFLRWTLILVRSAIVLWLLTEVSFVLRCCYVICSLWGWKSRYCSLSYSYCDFVDVYLCLYFPFASICSMLPLIIGSEKSCSKIGKSQVGGSTSNRAMVNTLLSFHPIMLFEIFVYKRMYLTALYWLKHCGDREGKFISYLIDY